jgi:hypothetical protein
VLLVLCDRREYYYVSLVPNIPAHTQSSRNIEPDTQHSPLVMPTKFTLTTPSMALSYAPPRSIPVVGTVVASVPLWTAKSVVQRFSRGASRTDEKTISKRAWWARRLHSTLCVVSVLVILMWLYIMVIVLQAWNRGTPSHDVMGPASFYSMVPFGVMVWVMGPLAVAVHVLGREE